MKTNAPAAMLRACCALTLAALPFALHAQPDALVSKLLFEPVPLPEDGTLEPIPLVAFSAAGADVPAPAAERPRLSDAERAEAEAAIESYMARLGASEAAEGPFSDDLREDLFNTGLLYQKLDDHTNALKLMERALAVSRINHGLQGLDQVPIMEAMAQSHLALEQITQADAMMTAAFQLQQDVYGAKSPGLVPALLRLGAWNTNAFMDRSSILLNIPRMDVQKYIMDPKGFIQAPIDMRDSPLYKLFEAQANYREAILALIDAKQFTHPDLLPLEHELVKNYFLITHRENILYEPDFYLTRRKEKTASRLDQNSIELMNSESFDLGRESYSRTLAYIYNDQAQTAGVLAQAMLEEADWHLLYERKPQAADKYEVTLRFFEGNPELGRQVQHLLYPPVPVVLPAFMPAPNSREKLGIPADADVSFFGYIDVAFSLNKFGKARRIRTLGTGGEVTRNMEIRLNQYLQNVQFRPRYKGTEVDTGDVRLRYYIGI